MADERGFGKLLSDSKDHISDNSYENGLLVDETDFSDPEEFVDKVSDDGLLHMLTLRFHFPRGFLRKVLFVVKIHDNSLGQLTSLPVDLVSSKG